MRNPVKNAFRALFHDPRHLVFAIFRRVPWLIPNDELYVKIYYWLEMRKPLNLDNPKTFNEKLQWLKLYDRQPEYVRMVDKYEVKQYVADKVGSQYVVPNLGVWDKPSQIDWNALPNQFVIKTNHDGGGNGIVICKDKNCFDKRKALRELRHSYRRNSYLLGREWPYKNVKKRIMAEMYLEDNVYQELRDYKFYCFDGMVKVMLIASGRGGGHTMMNYYDENFKMLDLDQGHPHIPGNMLKPKTFDEMKKIASILSKGIPQVRVDLYEVNGKVYFGELTFFDSGGTGAFHPQKWDEIFGSWIKLPEKTIN